MCLGTRQKSQRFLVYVLQEMLIPMGVVHMKFVFSACMLEHLTGSVIAAIHTRRVLEAPTVELQMCDFSDLVDASLDGLYVAFR